MEEELLLGEETEEYIKESINHTVGLPISNENLLRKILAVESSNLQLRQQCLSLRSKLNHKDQIIQTSKAEASMNAVALKKFVEENQKLVAECCNLLDKCNKWEKECSLYDHDRDVLMDFANDADERAKEAEARKCELEEEVKKLKDELSFYKSRAEGHLVDESGNDLHEEQKLLDSLLTCMFGNAEITADGNGHAFLEAHSGLEVCQKLLKRWTSLWPLTQKVVALAAEVKNLERDKDQMAINLHTAEEEVIVLGQENNILDEENKRLMRLCYRERHHGSGGSASGKGKRKCSHKTGGGSPVEKKIDFSDTDLQRQPLSPLQPNSPESRIHQK